MCDDISICHISALAVTLSLYWNFKGYKKDESNDEIKKVILIFW